MALTAITISHSLKIVFSNNLSSVFSPIKKPCPKKKETLWYTYTYLKAAKPPPNTVRLSA